MKIMCSRTYYEEETPGRVVETGHERSVEKEGATKGDWDKLCKELIPQGYQYVVNAHPNGTLRAQYWNRSFPGDGVSNGVEIEYFMWD